MTEDEYKQEIARLHDFTQRLAQRLYLAAEVLSIVAERKTKKAEVVAPSASDYRYDMETTLGSGR